MFNAIFKYVIYIPIDLITDKKLYREVCTEL